MVVVTSDDDDDDDDDEDDRVMDEMSNANGRARVRERDGERECG